MERPELPQMERRQLPHPDVAGQGHRVHVPFACGLSNIVVVSPPGGLGDLLQL